MSGSEHRVDGCKNVDARRASGPTGLISIAGSAGAFDALARLLSALSLDCPAAIAVALHTGRGSILVDALRPWTDLPVNWAAAGTVLEPAHVYVAPAETHLIVNPDARLTVSEAPRIRWFRPSADWLFETGAASFATRHVAIVLSGMMSDGAPKLGSVKRLGGTVYVQDPSTCRFPAMPKAAIATRQVDAVLSIPEMSRALAQLLARQEWKVDQAAWEDPFGSQVAS
jgi:two-component system chemotaxis response regulator CheB